MNDDLQKYLSEVIKTTKLEKIVKDPSSKIVTVCGPLGKDIDGFNAKFILDVQSELTKLNCLPFIPIITCNGDFLEKKDLYRVAHLKKIAMSDIVVFVNFWGDESYNGEGTNLEIRFSRLTNKTILYTYIPTDENYSYEEYNDLILDFIPLYKETKKECTHNPEPLDGVSFYKGNDASWE